MLERLLPSNPRARAVAATFALLALAGIYTQVVLPGPKGSGGRGTPLGILFEFALLGLLAGLTSCAIVLVYRVQTFINFSASSLGAGGAFFAVLLVRLTPTPVIVAVPAGLLLGGMLGAAFEVIFIRRFFNAPRLTLTVMTVLATVALIGVVLTEIGKLPFFPPASRVDPSTLVGPLSPKLPFPGYHFQVGGLSLRFGFGAIFAIWTAVILLAGLGYFFRFTRSGTAVRALSDNPDRAELLGISTRKLSTIIWIIVGVLGAAAGIAGSFLDIATTGASAASTDALLVPLAAAVLARMRSFTAALVSAVAITVVSGAATYTYPGSESAVTAAVFVLLCVGLFIQRDTLLRSEAQTAGGWAYADEVRPVPKELSSLPPVRRARAALVVALVAVAGLFPFLFSARLASLAGTALLFGIVALSLVVLTGWAGQISLGQVGFMAIGALVGGVLMTKVGVPFLLAVPITAAISGAVALVVGVPALRIKGLFLAAVTFGFGVAVNQFLFDSRYVKWLQPSAVSRPRLFFIDFADERSMYFLALGSVVLAAVVVVNLRRSRFGRVLIAMRDNEPALQAVGVSVVRMKLTAFVVSGALAGFAGIMFAVQQRGVSAGDFTSFDSLNVFAFTIVGGVTSVAGALLGQVAEFTLTHNAVTNQIFEIFVGFAPIGMLYFFPAGIIGILQTIRDGFLRIVAQRRQIVVPSLFADYDPEALARRLIPLTPPDGSGPSLIPAGATYRRQSSLYRWRATDTNGGITRSEESVAIGAAAGNKSSDERST